MWVTNEFYNTSGGNNSDYSKQWFIFEYSVDDGSNWSAANIFYRKSGNSSAFSPPSSSPTNDGWTATTTTGTYIELTNYYTDYFTIGTRVADGSVVKLRYKRAFTQSDLANASYIELGSQNKSTADRTAECDVDLTDFVEGSGNTDVTVNGTCLLYTSDAADE